MNAHSFRACWPLCLAFAALASPLGAQTPGDSIDTSERDHAGSFVGLFLGGVSAGQSGQRTALDSRLDFSAGAQWERVFETGVFLRSGVFYAGRGGSRTFSGVNVDLIAQYVEFPLLVGYRLPDAVRTRVFVMGGPQLGIQTSCKRQRQAVGMNVNENCDDGFFGPHETFDLALLAGGGISLALGKANLLVDFRLMQVHRESGSTALRAEEAQSERAGGGGGLA